MPLIDSLEKTQYIINLYDDVDLTPLFSSMIHMSDYVTINAYKDM